MRYEKWDGCDISPSHAFQLIRVSMTPEEHLAEARFHATLARRALASGESVKHATRCALCRHDLSEHFADDSQMILPNPAFDYTCRIGIGAKSCACPGFRLLQP